MKWLFSCGINVNVFLHFGTQWAGAAVLGIGIWLAVDQNSLLSLVKLAQADAPQLQVTNMFIGIIL